MCLLIGTVSKVIKVPRWHIVVYKIMNIILAISLKRFTFFSESSSVTFIVVSSSLLSYSTSWKDINFDKLKTNLGNAFSATNYRFIAPSAGLYSWNLDHGFWGETRLFVNGNTFHEKPCGNPCESTIPTLLSQKDKVWVTSNVKKYYMGSWFSGWKVHKLIERLCISNMTKSESKK